MICTVTEWRHTVQNDSQLSGIGRVYLKASRDIKDGEEVLTSYERVREYCCDAFSHLVVDDA